MLYRSSAFVVFVFAGSAGAQLIAFDDFTLPAGSVYPTPLVGAATVSIGFAGPWFETPNPWNSGVSSTFTLHGPAASPPVPGVSGSNAMATGNGNVSRRLDLSTDGFATYLASDGTAIGAPGTTLWVGLTMGSTYPYGSELSFTDVTSAGVREEAFRLNTGGQFSQIVNGIQRHSGGPRYEPRSSEHSLYVLKLTYAADHTLVSLFANPPAPTSGIAPLPDVTAYIARGDTAAPNGQARWNTIRWATSGSIDDRFNSLGNLRIGGTYADVAPTDWTFPTTWRGDSDGNWFDPTRWSGPIPQGFNSLAVFGPATSPRIVTIPYDLTVDDLRFDSDVSYTLSGPGRILSSRRDNPDWTYEVPPHQIEVVRGSHALDVVVANSATTHVKVPTGTFLSIRAIEGGELTVDGGGTVNTTEELRVNTLEVLSGSRLNASATSSDSPALHITATSGSRTSTISTNSQLVVRAPGKVSGVQVAAVLDPIILAGRLVVQVPSIANAGPLAIIWGGGVYYQTGLGITGSLDLTSNMYVEPWVFDRAALEALVASGHAGGLWNGNGINSSLAGPNGPTGAESLALIFAPDTLLELLLGSIASYVGPPTNPRSAAVIYTYLGDANVDGIVNTLDRLRLDAGLADPSLNGWSNGDFNYDGRIDAADLGLFNQGLSSQGRPLGLAALIPEPETLSAVAPALLLLTRRRR